MVIVWSLVTFIIIIINTTIIIIFINLNLILQNVCSNRRLYISLVLRENSQGWHNVWGCTRKYCGHKKLPQKWSRQKAGTDGSYTSFTCTHALYTLSHYRYTSTRIWYEVHRNAGDMVIHQRKLLWHAIEEMVWHIIERYGLLWKIWLPPLKTTEMCR